MSTRKSTSVYIAAFLLFAAGIGFMVWSALSEDSVYHLNVAEAAEMPESELRSARIFGVVSDDITRPENGLGADFTAYDLEKPQIRIKVSYRGVVPDTFEKGSEVIIEGGMHEGVFAAKTLMTKCPSKYEKSSRENR